MLPLTCPGRPNEKHKREKWRACMEMMRSALCSPTEATNRQRPSHTGSIAFFAAWSYMVLS